MPMYYIRSNAFLILIFAWCRLASAVCLDSACASSPESDVGVKASLLQQNAVRSVPAQAYQAPTVRENPLEVNLEAKFKSDEEAQRGVDLWDSLNKMEEMRSSDQVGSQLKPHEVAQLRADSREALNLEDMRSLEKVRSTAQENDSKLKVEVEKNLDRVLEEEDLRSVAAERLKAVQKSFKAKREAEEVAAVVERGEAAVRAIENLEAEAAAAAAAEAEEAKKKAKEWENHLDKEDLKAFEAFKAELAEERKKKAKMWEQHLDKEDLKALEAFRVEKAREKKLKAEKEAKLKGSAQTKPENKPIAMPANEKSVSAQNLVALKPQQISNVSLPANEVFVALKSESEGLSGASAAVEAAKSAAAAAKAAEADAVVARREVDIKASAAQLAIKKATESKAAASEAVKKAASVQEPQGDLKNYVNSALIDRTHKVIMGWTPRAACTATVHMFFLSAGMYTPKDEERFPWVHDYREALGDWAMPQIADMNNPKFTKFKIARNPYTRAISNWGHQMETNFSYNAAFQELATANGVSDRSNFLEWLRFIQKVGNFKEFRKERLDQHSWPQFSNWEKMGGRYDVIIQLEEPGFKDKLDQINNRHHSKLLFKTMHVSLAQDQNSTSPTVASSINNNTSERPPFASELYGVRAEPRSPSHKSKQLYTEFPEAIHLVEEIYDDDFKAYGYPRDVTKVYED